MFKAAPVFEIAPVYFPEFSGICLSTSFSHMQHLFLAIRVYSIRTVPRWPNTFVQPCFGALISYYMHLKIYHSLLHCDV